MEESKNLAEAAEKIKFSELLRKSDASLAIGRVIRWSIAEKRGALGAWGGALKPTRNQLRIGLHQPMSGRDAVMAKNTAAMEILRNNQTPA